jgi:hemoglobin-like flavoprotein
MNPNQVDLIRDSFVQMLVDSERSARLFYGRLFELAPETRRLFKGDMAEQGRQLIEALARIVTGLSRLDAMLPELRKLAARHVRYGVEDRHYSIVGDALQHVVTVYGGPDADPAMLQAWKVAYALVAGAMIEAANDFREITTPPDDRRRTTDVRTMW